MPLFHFNISDGRSSNEVEPMLLPDTMAARVEAIRIIGIMLRDQSDRVTPHRPLVVRVVDERGLVAARVALSVFDASTLKGKHRRPAVEAAT